MFNKLYKLRKLFDSLSDDERAEFVSSISEEDEEETPDVVEDEKPTEDVDTPSDASDTPEDETTPEEPQAEEPMMEEEPPMEEEVSEEEMEETEEVQEENEESVVDILTKKVDNAIEQLNGLAEKVEKFMAKFDAIDDGEGNEIGLDKQRDVAVDDSDEDLSAYDYAMKYAKY